jgi:hypothetical protein
MALPKQIREQAAELEEIEKQLYGDQQPTDPDVPVAEVVTPEAKQSAEPIKQPEPETVEEAPEKQEKDDAKVWQQKYKTLQGMYDAEVPRLHAQLKTMQAEFDTLKSNVEKAGNEAEESKKVAKKAASRNLVTDEDRQEFGEEMIAFQRKVAREETAELSDKLEAVAAQNSELNDQLVRQGETVRESSFEQRLTSLVPDFAQLNIDPVWIKWLGEIDPMLRGPRSSAAQRAFTEGDAEGVAHYVNLFRESQQGAEPAKKDNSLELESQIQPLKVASTTQSRSSQKGKLYTDNDIRGMFAKVMQLNNSNRTDDAQKLEAEIDAAYAQGRVSA